MLNVIVTFLIIIFLMVLPLVMVLRAMTSESTRSHLTALILHDLITGIWKMCGRLVIGALRLAWRGLVLMTSSLSRFFRP